MDLVLQEAGLSSSEGTAEDKLAMLKGLLF